MNTCANVQNNFFKSELYAKNNFSKSYFLTKNSFYKSNFSRGVSHCGVYIQLVKGILRCQEEDIWGNKAHFLLPLRALGCHLSMFEGYMVWVLIVRNGVIKRQKYFEYSPKYSIFASCYASSIPKSRYCQRAKSLFLVQILAGDIGRTCVLSCRVCAVFWGGQARSVCRKVRRKHAKPAPKPWCATQKTALRHVGIARLA